MTARMNFLMKQKLLSNKDLDWVSLKEGLMTGPYYQKPMVTQFGTRHSGKDMRIRLPNGL